MKFSEVAFFTDNVDAVANFYERLLATRPVFRGEGIAIFQHQGTQILIHTTYQPKPGEPPCENHVGFAVPDLDCVCHELRSRNIKIERSPEKYPWGRSAYLRDPDGQLIELHESNSHLKEDADE